MVITYKYAFNLQFKIESYKFSYILCVCSEIIKGFVCATSRYSIWYSLIILNQ